MSVRSCVVVVIWAALNKSKVRAKFSLHLEIEVQGASRGRVDKVTNFGL